MLDFSLGEGEFGGLRGDWRVDILMRHRTFALLFGAVLACAAATQARAAMFDRLQQQHFGDIAPGSYQAGDKIRFTLDRYQNQFLMRFAGQPEVYVLYADFASLGGRVLRYDSGGVAIQVTGWGALTVYTDNARAIALYEKAGFAHEGTHRAYALRAGRFVDAHAMARLHPNPPPLSA